MKLQIAKFFRKFLSSGKSIAFQSEFSEEDKKQIINSALTTSSHVLISAMVMTNSHNFITGSFIMPDNTKYTLTFTKDQL